MEILTPLLLIGLFIFTALHPTIRKQDKFYTEKCNMPPIWALRILFLPIWLTMAIVVILCDSEDDSKEN